MAAKHYTERRMASLKLAVWVESLKPQDGRDLTWPALTKSADAVETYINTTANGNTYKDKG